MIGGIVGYGAYVPRYRITLQEIAQATNRDAQRMQNLLSVEEKSVPGKDEDAITMAVHAGKNALRRAEIDATQISAVYMGSESHPYAAKPSATIVGQALGIEKRYTAADLEFACKGGTAALQVSLGMVGAGICDYALTLAADTAQAAPGDVLEFSAGAGAAAFIVSNNPSDCCVVVHKTLSISTDTPDFWRRSMQKYPEHLGRFTAEPAYFQHIAESTKNILDESGMQPSEFDYVVFHQPNGKFPEVVAKKLGFSKQQYEQSLIVKKIGNSYSASSLLALTSIFDQAQPNQNILLVSYGSGSGSDAFIMTTTDLIAKKQMYSPTTASYISQKTLLSYAQYRNHMELIY